MPRSSETLAPPVGAPTHAPPIGSPTPPPIGSTSLAQRVGSTPLAPPAGPTTLAPRIGSTPLAPPAGSTSLAPPAGPTTLAPPTGSTPLAPPAGPSTLAQRIGSTPLALPAGLTAPVPRAGGATLAPPVRALLRRYREAGEPLSCEPVTQGLLNRGYRLSTTRGAYFLKQHLDAPTADRDTISRQHRATQRLHALGLPVAPPLADSAGRTVAVIGGRCYALHPWIDGRHRYGAQLSTGGSRRLGALLGHVHTCLEQVMESPPPGDGHESARPEDTLRVIDELLRLARAHRPRTGFDALAEHRLLERRVLLAEHAHRRPPRATSAGWVHGDFHPLNLLYRGAEPAAIVDWDRLGVQPRAEEAVRAAAIFFVRPAGELALKKVRAYARAYRRAAGADGAELASAVHRVWWERLNDFWILRWRYQLHDRRADPQFPAASALAVWWTREYEAVRDAFAG